MSTDMPGVHVGAADVVLEAFAEVTGVDAPRGLDTTPANVAEWDSLRHVYLVNAIELRLGVVLPVDTLITRSSLADLANAVAAAQR